jgi:hypothetical protein
MNRAFGLAVLGVILTSIDARSEECTPIDLRQSSFKGVPVQDQDGMGFCYGYAAAAMVDGWRFSHGDQRRSHLTSGIEATITHGSESHSAGEKSAEFRRQQLAYIQRNAPPGMSGKEILKSSPRFHSVRITGSPPSRLPSKRSRTTPATSWSR